MRPRVRVKVWPFVILVVAVLVAYLIWGLVRPRPAASPIAPTPSPVPPTPTAGRVTPIPVPTASGVGTAATTITGQWTGTLRQPGAPISIYTFSLSLSQQATGAVSGTARAEVPNQAQYYVVESITGQVSGAEFAFQRGSILESGPPGRGWCIDSGQLTLSPDGSTMTGTWQGRGCGSGPLALARVSSPAAVPPRS